MSGEVSASCERLGLGGAAALDGDARAPPRWRRAGLGAARSLRIACTLSAASASPANSSHSDTSAGLAVDADGGERDERRQRTPAPAISRERIRPLFVPNEGIAPFIGGKAAGMRPDV